MSTSIFQKLQHIAADHTAKKAEAYGAEVAAEAARAWGDMVERWQAIAKALECELAHQLVDYGYDSFQFEVTLGDVVVLARLTDTGSIYLEATDGSGNAGVLLKAEDVAEYLATLAHVVTTSPRATQPETRPVVIIDANDTDGIDSLVKQGYILFSAALDGGEAAFSLLFVHSRVPTGNVATIPPHYMGYDGHL